MHKTVFAILFVTLVVSCTHQEIESCDASESLFSISNYPIGAALNTYELYHNQAYHKIAKEQFNSVTAENIFKASYLHPTQNMFYWAEADSLVQYCLKHNKRLHGHTLIWHKQLPEWIQRFQGDQDDWEKLFKNHIQSICLHFKGKVRSWDVVNEAFNDDGTLRNTIWKEKIGSSYIEKAFKYAHMADPDALLFYNDYDIALNEKKRNAIIDLLNNLRQRGIPVHGIGMQMHISISHPMMSQVSYALNAFVAMDYKIHISELDISVNPFGKEIDNPEPLFDKQAYRLALITHLYNNIPTNLQYGITFWGISDQDSWIRDHFNRIDYPLLFDDNYLPKPAYCKFKESL